MVLKGLICLYIHKNTIQNPCIFNYSLLKVVEIRPEVFQNKIPCRERVVGEVAGGGAWQVVFNSSGWHEEIQERLRRFEDDLVTAVGDQLYDQGPDEQRERWNVIGSLFYCVTVITTIGYGHISPRTRLGKMVTIFYAIIGIPLMLLCLTNIGDAMASSFRFMYRRVCCVCCSKNQEAEEESPLTNPTNR
ncbi:Potassium channel subfamily K member 18 [Portunus trituberculatus]|uniref:Potassium channel subfamily K member 18 n=1 Tax=Portunus trituberculatus TaxID=210409 RepID=A0A5B7CX65_PORTR|nr:Potassium channel subfamily K member 18 [Portunus trituberculatus]